MPTWPAGDLEGRQLRPAVGDLDLDLLVVQLVGAQPLAEASRVAGDALAPTSASSTRSSALFSACALTSLRLHLAHQADADLDQVAHDRVDVAADIADLGELGRLDLEERRAREPGQAARDLGLADAGRADHQDVLGQHLFACRSSVQLLAPPAVAQRDGHRALGVVLADDVAVELGDDLAGREGGHGVDYLLRVVTDHQKRAAVRGVDLAVAAETRFLVGADGTRVGGVGVGDDAGRAGRQKSRPRTCG